MPIPVRNPDEYVRTHQKADKLTVIRDSVRPGLGLLVGPRGRPSWTFVYRPQPNSKQVRVKLGFAWTEPGAPSDPEYLTTDGARAKAYQIREAAKAGIDMRPEKPAPQRAPKALTFDGALMAYLDAVQPKTRQQMEKMVRKDCAPLLARPLTAITYQDTDAIVQAVIDRGSPIAARNLFLTLRAMFRWAVRNRKITEVPMIGDAPTKSRARDRTLTDCELAAAWRATEDSAAPLRAAVRAMILLGQRREEIGSMRWSQIDEATKTWTISGDDYKTGALQFLPLDSVWDIIAETPRIEGSDYVFTFNGRGSVDLSKEAGKLVKRAKTAHWTFHDLRRTARTNWSKLKIDPTIRERLIHPVPGVEGTYDRYDYLDEKREALAKWREYVAGLV
jgi:integrase